MKRIKSFKIFESIDINDVKEAIRQNDFDKFKDLVVDLDEGSQILILKNSAEHCRVEFVSYLLDLYDFTSEDIDSVITWIGHSPITKRISKKFTSYGSNFPPQRESVLDILNRYTDSQPVKWEDILVDDIWGTEEREGF